MNAPVQLSRGRIATAVTIAVLTDLVQLPVNVLYMTGVLAVPGEVLDVFFDGVAFVSTTALLGFHWVLLPTVLLEAVPFADALPSWTLCVVFVVSRRKKDALLVAESNPPRIVDAQALRLELPQLGMGTPAPEPVGSWVGVTFTPSHVPESVVPQVEPGALPENDGP